MQINENEYNIDESETRPSPANGAFAGRPPCGFLKVVRPRNHYRSPLGFALREKKAQLAQCRFCKGVMWGAYVEGWWTITILSTPSFSTFAFYCTHPRPPPLRSHFAGGWMCCSVDSEMGERERRKGMRWKWPWPCRQRRERENEICEMARVQCCAIVSETIGVTG